MAGDRRDPMGADLLRQRRNLLIISLGLVAVDLAGAKFQPHVSIFGAGINFDHPERLLTGAWILWLYFLLRYSQYVKEEPSLGIQEVMNGYLVKWCDIDTDDHEYIYYVWWKNPVFWVLQSYERERSPDESSPHRNPKSRWTVIWWTARAFTLVAAKTPRVTDYLFPFLIASLPVLLALRKLL